MAVGNTPRTVIRVTSFNINGIRAAARKGFFSWFEDQDIDILCLQELRAHAHQWPPEASPAGYHRSCHFARRPGYAGTALYSRRRPQRVHLGLSGLDGSQWAEMDAEGRYVQADFGRLAVISVYFPSGSSAPERQAVKYDFLDRFLPWLKKLRAAGREILLCGDINIAHRKIDLKNWRGNQKNSGFLPRERAWMDRLFTEAGFVDVYRHLYPEREQYTWWSNRGRAREKNVGWRIDYQIATPAIASLAIEAEVYTGAWFSDHAPLTITYDLEL